MNFLMNLIWFVLGGFISFISWIVIGILWCLTIVGIPIGMQCFKFAVMAAVPFGREIRISESGTSLVLNIIWMLLGRFGIGSRRSHYGRHLLHDNRRHSVRYAALQACQVGIDAVRSGNLSGCVTSNIIAG